MFAGTESVSAVEVSDETELFARSHGLWGSLILIKELILRGGGCVVLAIKVNLRADPDVRDRYVIEFNIHTDRTVADVLAFDADLQGAIFEKVPVEQQTHFAVRFDFA
jgi:hypothetical protein